MQDGDTNIPVGIDYVSLYSVCEDEGKKENAHCWDGRAEGRISF